MPRYARRVIPGPFQTRRALKILNVGAVGLALAAVTSAVLTGMLHEPAGATSLATGIPTLLVGSLWAWALRRPGTVRNTSFRWGWVASMPLAMLNGALASGALMGFAGPQVDMERFFLGAFLGATVGSLIWFPALVGTLICFGVPIAWGQRLAKQGLAGEERGEWIVGLICLVMSLLGLFLSFEAYGAIAARDLVGVWMTRGFGVLGALAAATSTGLAFAREARRRRFVADAEAGQVPGYRIEPTDEGKVLIRVVSRGEGYRVADFEEEVFELDAQGQATRPKEMVVDAPLR